MVPERATDAPTRSRLLGDPVAIAAFVFIVLNTAFMAAELYWLNVVPLLVLVVWALMARPESVLLFVVFATPLSLNLEQLAIGGIGVSLPTEPLMVALMGLFLVRTGLEGGLVDRAVMRHPITRVVIAQLLWMGVSVVTSSMPLVSLKFLVARCWFVFTMYFMATVLFRDERNMWRFCWLFAAGLGIVVVYTLVHHSQYDFAHDPGHWVMTPFFKDHTSYGAVLAFIIPFVVMALFQRRGGAMARGGLGLFAALLLVGLVFSYTRAAWLGLAGAAALMVVMRLRIPAWSVALLAVFGGGLLLANMSTITRAMERNDKQSSDDLAEHVSSISNISSDASNLERINRWNSALRMFADRPMMGFGPGTYMFQYAPFQDAADLTIISTNFGEGGNAHSEYLGPLAEQGLPGAALMVVLVVLITSTAIRLWSRMPPGRDRALVMSVFLGLVTYFVHGVLNNFLDLDKASVPFWGFTAIIVLMDLKYPRAQANRQVSSAMSSK